MGIFGNIRNLFTIRYNNGSWWINNNTTKNNSLEYMQIYNTVYSVNACINLGALYASKFKWGVLEKSGKINYDHKLLEIINNPNPYQNTIDLVKQLYVYKSVNGWCYQKKFGSKYDYPRALYNLDPTNITFKTKYKEPLLVWERTDVKKLKQDSFIYNDNGINKTFYFNDILPFYDLSNGIKCNNTDDSYSIYKSPSKLTSVLKSITNSDLTLDAENVALQTIGREAIYGENDNKGPLKDNFIHGVNTISENNRKDISSKLNDKTKLRQQLIRTFTPDVPITHKDLSLKLKDYNFDEVLSRHEKIIAAAFNVPNELYQSYKTGATFENQKTAIVKFVDDIAEHFINDLAKSWTEYFGDKNTPFVATANHLRVLKEEKAKEADKALKISQTLYNLQRAGIDDGLGFLNDLGININE